MSAASTPLLAPRVSVVIIGRNEGERLARCLRSVAAADWRGIAREVLYVDSRSSDGSLQRAAELGAQTLLLDDQACCAAKARNLGWRAARGTFVLFLDADTELAPGFVRTALAALDDPRLCAVWGHRRESDPSQSVYTRMLDLDWLYPAGRSLYFGGDVLVRREALLQSGGFDPTLNAGEEPELGLRLRRLGWTIDHLDTPMTRHDLAIRDLGAYLRRAYRSGIAYAEVAARAQAAGDTLWQREAKRDLVHGALYMVVTLLAPALVLWQPAWAHALAVACGLLLARTAWRSRWKAPGQPGLLLGYAAHVHAQKIPAFWGQLAWRWSRWRGRSLGLVDYKTGTPARPSRHWKAALAAALRPAAAVARLAEQRLARLWAFARLEEAIGGGLDASNVILGRVTVDGTRHVRFGRNALVYPGVVLETQGTGRIEIGDGVVLSRGVHIVAFDRVVLEAGCMVGEFSSIRDANHRTNGAPVRTSGHDASAVQLGADTWIGRGAAVLAGVSIGRGTVVGANAVVTRSLPAQVRAAGVPARPFGQPTRSLLEPT